MCAIQYMYVYFYIHYCIKNVSSVLKNIFILNMFKNLMKGVQKSYIF